MAPNDGPRTIADLQAEIQSANLGWSVHPRLKPTDPIPTHPLGGDRGNLPPADAVPHVDLAAIFRAMPINNPLLVQRRIELGLMEAPDELRGFRGSLPDVAVTTAANSLGRTLELKTSIAGRAGTPAPPPASGGGPAASVDWRNRWGWPWITSVRDQDPCESCWAFAATALVEATTRIQHAYWTHRSEGDVHDGMGAKCANTGSAQAALDWIKQHGICDPDCYPYRTDDPPYNPTPDRNGRTVKLDDYQFLGSISDQKAWIDTVGPIVTWFDVYTDFGAVGTGVYRKSPSATERGGHFMLVVGYNDAGGYWICKNSWGTGFGDGGFCKVAYGETGIDSYAKIGAKSLNPDPWTKRRFHNGNMIESGDGSAHRNFEMLATVHGNEIQHWWRDNSTAGFPWHAATVFANDASVCPTLTGTTYNRNFECVYLAGSRLHHYWLDQTTDKWNDGGIFGPNDAAGVPGFIQGNYGAPGNFEVVVRTADGKLNHWWRTNGPPWTWSDGGRFGSGVMFSGPALIQSNYGTRGNLELVCVLNSGQMQHWWRDDDHGNVWHPGPTFGANCSSAPCMIEGQFGMGTEDAIGNFELCVAVGGRVQHWWRNNSGGMAWSMSATFGHDVQAVTALIQGSFGFNLEVIVLRTDGMLQHYWRDGAGWHEGPVIGSAR
ncbi:MAG TPA: C1 family peptidase [Actinomycetota bacterium]